MKRVYLIFIFILLGLASIVAVIFRTNITTRDISEQRISNILVSQQEWWSNLDMRSFLLEYDNPKEVIETSDLIVRVLASEERSNQGETILTEVKVIQVIKGDTFYNNLTIFVHEPAFIMDRDNKYFYMSTTSYVLMKPQNEYLLFLRLLRRPEGYKYNDTDLRTFLINNKAFGKYSVLLTTTKAFKDKNATFSSIRDYDLITNSQALIDEYYLWKDEIFKSLGISLIKKDK